MSDYYGITPGPWQVNYAGGGQIEILAPDGIETCGILAHVYMLDEDEPGDGMTNARLIAAAPRMYEELVAMLGRSYVDALVDNELPWEPGKATAAIHPSVRRMNPDGSVGFVRCTVPEDES